MPKKVKPERGHGAVKYLPLKGKKIVTAKIAKEIRQKHNEWCTPHDVLATEYGIDPMLALEITRGVTVKVFGEKKKKGASHERAREDHHNRGSVDH